MLVENHVDLSGRIIAVKLTTGEELVARCMDDNADVSVLSLRRPVSLVMSHDAETDQAMVAFAPWMLALPDDAIVRIGRSRVVYAGEARRDVTEQYKEAVNDIAPMSGAVQDNVASRGRR
jgi:hypothetical protein